jgi:hypothetical protein
LAIRIFFINHKLGKTVLDSGLQHGPLDQAVQFNAERILNVTSASILYRVKFGFALLSADCFEFFDRGARPDVIPEDGHVDVFREPRYQAVGL